MKTYAVLFNLFCLAGFVFAQDKLPRIVRVVGAAEVKVVPDRAIIELGVQKQDPNAGAAKRAADVAARRILATLRANGVDDKDIQTTYLSLQPESYVRKGLRVSYFVAQQTLSVTVRDLGRIDALLQAIIQAGGNRIDSIAYETSELRKYRDQARDMAVKAAREKAAALAQALGQEVGKAHSIEEVAETDYERTRQVQANAYAFTENGIHARSIAPGQTSISASVIVSFDLN